MRLNKMVKLALLGFGESEHDKWAREDPLGLMQTKLRDWNQHQKYLHNMAPATDKGYMHTMPPERPEHEVSQTQIQRPVGGATFTQSPASSRPAVAPPVMVDRDQKSRVMMLDSLANSLRAISNATGHTVTTDPATAAQMRAAINLHGHKDFRTVEGIAEAKKAQNYRAEAKVQRNIAKQEYLKSDQLAAADGQSHYEHPQVAAPQPMPVPQTTPVQTAPVVKAPERMGDGTLRNTAQMMTGKPPVEQAIVKSPVERLVPTQQASK